MEDDIPPLEDMTTLVDRVKEKQKSTQKVESQSFPEKSRNEPATLTNQPTKTSTKKKSDVGYGGMKKGFLFGNVGPKSSKSMKKSAAAKPTVDYEVKAAASDKKYVFDEVQEAIKENKRFPIGSEWVTDDLLQKVEGNKALVKKLTDPKYSQALQRMEADPIAAKKYYENDKDVQEFFMDFYQILGQHFMNFGEQTNASTSTASLSKSDDEIRFEKILAQPEIKAILEKPNIKHLFKVLRSDPEEGQRLFFSSSDETKADVKKLTDVGLLGFETNRNT